MGPESLIRRLGVFARRHGWDGGFVLLFAVALLLGGNAVPAGVGAFAESLLPAMPAEAYDQPSRVAEGVARLPMFAFAGPARYGPAVLFPITGHVLPA